MPDSPFPAAADIDLQALQRKRKQVLALGGAVWLLLLLFTQSRWRAAAPHLQALIEIAGLVLILICILGRTWCTLYIGGHKKRELVTAGPYSVVRNPSTSSAPSARPASAPRPAARSSPSCLRWARWRSSGSWRGARRRSWPKTFPAEFGAYSARVPRFWPRLSQWREADELRVKPRLVRRTFLEACLFLLAVPAAQFAAWLQQVGQLPVLFSLP